MLMKILVSILLLQATMSMAEKCPDEEIVTQKVTDVNESIGNWSVVYVWTKEISFRAMGRSLCFNSSLEHVTAEEVAAKKEECKDSHVPFDYDSVIMKIVIRNVPSSDRLVSHDGENTYIQQNCNLVTEVEARKVSDNYVLMVYPGSDVAELLSKTVPDREELLCTARNIDIMKNKIGFPLCFK